MKLTKEEVQAILAAMNWLKGFANHDAAALETIQNIRDLLAEAALRSFERDDS